MAMAMVVATRVAEAVGVDEGVAEGDIRPEAWRKPIKCATYNL